MINDEDYVDNNMKDEEKRFKTLDPSNVEKLTKWKNEPTIQDLKADYLNASPDQDANITKINTWLDYLNVEGVAKQPKKKGRSSITPKLIRKQAEWRYAALSEPFLDNEDIFKVAPVTYEDKEAAEQNELILNYQFNNKINKTKFIDEFVRTAVDEGTVIVRVGWEFEKRKVEQPAFEFQPSQDPQVLQKIEFINKITTQDPNYLNQLNPEVKQAYELSMQNNMPIEAVEVGTEEVEITYKNHPTVEVVDYRNIIIDPTAKGDIDKAQFVIHSFETCLADLEHDPKYQNLDKLDMGTIPIIDPDFDDGEDDDNSFQFEDEKRKKFVMYEYWGFWDIEGDGILVPIVAAYVGDILIRMEKNPFPDGELPFVVVQYLPVRRSMYGEPDGELLRDNQEIIGAVTRGMIDIMARNANGQMGRMKNVLDVVNKRRFNAGEDYEYNGNVNPDHAFFMHKYPEIPNSAQLMITLQNAEAESLTGVRPFAQSTTGNIGSDTATGVKSAMDAATKREMGILRRLSSGIIKIGRKIVAMNGVFLNEEETVRITNNEFIDIRRDNLIGEFDFSLSISTAESDAAKAEELAFMLQTTGQNMGPEFVKLILADIAKLRKMPALARKIEAYEPKPDENEIMKQQLEIKLLEAQIYNETAKGHENTANANLDNAKAEAIKSGKDLDDLEFIERESGIKHQRELEFQGEQARSNILLEREKHLNKVEQDLLKETVSNNSNSSNENKSE